MLLALPLLVVVRQQSSAGGRRAQMRRIGTVFPAGAAGEAKLTGAVVK
jgi:hypothetical protein